MEWNGDTITATGTALTGLITTIALVVRQARARRRRERERERERCERPHVDSLPVPSERKKRKP